MRNVVLSLTAAALLATSAQASDLGGIALGATPTAAALTSFGIEPPAEMHGTFHGTKRFDTVDTNTNVTLDSNGKVIEVSVDFHTLDTDLMLNLARRKFGKPASASKLTFGLMAVRLYTWETKDADIVLESYDPNAPDADTEYLKRGSLRITTLKIEPKGGNL